MLSRPKFPKYVKMPLVLQLVIGSLLDCTHSNDTKPPGQKVVHLNKAFVTNHSESYNTKSDKKRNPSVLKYKS